VTLINRIVNAAPIPDKFKTPGFLRSSASVAEQILLSASSFIAALVVVALSGMEALGVYSVVLIIANYAKSVFATVFHRQMVLAISAKSTGVQNGVLLATLSMELVFAALLVLLCFGLGHLIDQYTTMQHAHLLLGCVAAYIVSTTLFDLFRQFLYATDRQVFSFECTVGVVTLQFIGFALLLLLDQSTLSVYWYFLVLALGFVGGIAINHVCLRVLKHARWRGWNFSFAKLQSYWQHARFSLVGMSITWLQNQSVTPLLLFLTSPLIVGYFSFARLMVMPLSVVNQGLINNSTPQLRRLAEKNTPESVATRLRELSNTNLIISLVYVLLLGLSHVSGVFHALVSDYDAIAWFLGFWIVSLIVTMQRFWISQFFVVHMRFKFLLISSSIVALFSLTGMITVGLLFDNVTLPLLFFIGGELLFIVLLMNAKRNYTSESI